MTGQRRAPQPDRTDRTSEPDRQDTLLVSCLVCPVFGHGQDGQMSGLSGLSDRGVPTGQTGHLSKEMSGLSCLVGVPYLCWRWLVDRRGSHHVRSRGRSGGLVMAR